MNGFTWPRLVLLGVFVASLLGNFFSLGYVFKQERDAPVMSTLAEGAFSTYPDDVRTEFRRLLRENRSQTIQALRELRGARRELASVSALPLKEAEVRKAMADVRNATDALQRLMQDLLLEALRSTDRARGGAAKQSGTLN
ncbi:putative membrane protein [Phyllobacterium trifolii]|uniref:Putative membrane protein n=1 Tax=Phyllobacterium trifolii TaxID=300193 RepID=A0A839UJB3_9HYPH|nr:periplasmic heavy metal sensor [Phyllobacterium trifolii]MBB3149843.1 putative membrane protein [Phyllobacterium trifolii]